MTNERYIIENEELCLTIDAFGAEAVSLIDKKSGSQMLWSGDPGVWSRHAPLLFPYTGRLRDNTMTAKGKTFTGAQHGFARDFVHKLAAQTKDSATLELRDDERTMELWPYHFLLRSEYRLEGRTVHHTVTVENEKEDMLQFGLGFHPGFAIPFDENHTAADYEFRFDKMESPICLGTLPQGLLNGRFEYLARNITSIPLTEDIFDNDSFCMTNLVSSTLGIYERDTGRNVTCGIEGFPYVLIWSSPTRPLRFVCIEPWMSLPAEENGSTQWEEQAAAARLAKGESYSVALSMTFDR